MLARSHAVTSGISSIALLFGAAVLLVIPSLALLYVLTQRSMLEEEGG